MKKYLEPPSAKVKPGMKTRYGFSPEVVKAYAIGRQRFLRSQVRCKMCGGLFKNSLDRILDHKRPHRGDEKLFLDPTNWQALCKRCHDSHKQRHERSKVLAVGLDGYPVEEPRSRGGRKDG